MAGKTATSRIKVHPKKLVGFLCMYIYIVYYIYNIIYMYKHVYIIVISTGTIWLDMHVSHAHIPTNRGTEDNPCPSMLELNAVINNVE